jgi:hypothetical protein
VAQKSGARILEGEEAKKAATDSWRGKHVKLSDVCYEDPKHRTYRELAAKAEKKSELSRVIAIDARRGVEGEAVELVERKALVEALKAAGDATGEKLSRDRGGGAGGGSDEAKRRADAKRRAEVARRGLDEMIDGATRLEGLAAWQLVTHLILSRAHWEASKRTATRRGFVDGKAEHDKAEKGIRRAIDEAATLDDVIGLALELLTTEDAAGNEWSSGYGDEFKRAASLVGVDLKALEKKVRAEESEKQKAKASKPKKAAAAAESLVKGNWCHDPRNKGPVHFFEDPNLGSSICGRPLLSGSVIVTAQVLSGIGKQCRTCSEYVQRQEKFRAPKKGGN